MATLAAASAASDHLLRRVGTLCLNSPAPSAAGAGAAEAEGCTALPDALLDAPLFYAAGGGGGAENAQLSLFRRVP
jgi:hypothetical protein